jgi:cellulose synthase/poly-beta-1,6-N-acetylglucosamine synthase-like glycosyltransferase
LKYLVQHFQKEEVVAVTSAIKTLDSKNFWALLQKAEFLTSAILRKTFAHLGSIFITPGPFSIMRTSVVKELGGWKKAHNTEDLEIGIRIQMKNLMIENEERSIVWTKPLTTFKALYKQRRRWVYGFLKNAWDYKFLFFNKKYGNLGMLILPSYLIGLVLTILMYFIFWFYFLTDFWKWIEKVSLVGYKFSWPSLDWFYFNTDTAMFVMIILILFSLYFLIEAKRITNEKNLFGIEIILYVFLYALISPLWLIGALWQAITKQENVWEDN